jgi:hypothetical protein
MKTIREWLESIADDKIREAAIHNMGQAPISTENTLEVSLERAISGAFIWRKSTEGLDYWMDIHEQVCRGTLKTKDA